MFYRMSEGNARLEVPGVLIHREGELFAALEPGEVEEERARPELFFHTAYWRLLIWRDASWQDAGYATSQTESGRGFLARRVMTTLGMFDGRVIEEFSFRMTHEPLPLLSGRIPTEGIDSAEPAVARLREICRNVANTVTNAQQSLQVLDAFSTGAEAVVEMKDGFDYSTYYIPVMPGQDAREIVARETRLGMQRFMGILTRERAAQIWPELATQRGAPAPENAADSLAKPAARASIVRRMLSRLFGRRG